MRGSFNVLPGHMVDNVVNLLSVQSKSFSHDVVRHTCCRKRSNFSDDALVRLSPTRFLATVHTPTLDSVRRILARCAECQVGRLKARRPVAQMLYLQATRYRPYKQLIRNAMNPGASSVVSALRVSSVVGLVRRDQAVPIAIATGQEISTQSVWGILSRHHESSKGDRGVSPMVFTPPWGILCVGA